MSSPRPRDRAPTVNGAWLAAGAHLDLVGKRDEPVAPVKATHRPRRRSRRPDLARCDSAPRRFHEDILATLPRKARIDGQASSSAPWIDQVVELPARRRPGTRRRCSAPIGVVAENDVALAPHQTNGAATRLRASCPARSAGNGRAANAGRERLALCWLPSGSTWRSRPCLLAFSGNHCAFAVALQPASVLLRGRRERAGRETKVRRSFAHAQGIVCAH